MDRSVAWLSHEASLSAPLFVLSKAKSLSGWSGVAPVLIRMPHQSPSVPAWEHCDSAKKRATNRARRPEGTLSVTAELGTSTNVVEVVVVASGPRRTLIVSERPPVAVVFPPAITWLTVRTRAPVSTAAMAVRHPYRRITVFLLPGSVPARSIRSCAEAQLGCGQPSV